MVPKSHPLVYLFVILFYSTHLSQSLVSSYVYRLFSIDTNLEMAQTDLTQKKRQPLLQPFYFLEDIFCKVYKQEEGVNAKGRDCVWDILTSSYSYSIGLYLRTIFPKELNWFYRVSKKAPYVRESNTFQQNAFQNF